MKPVLVVMITKDYIQAECYDSVLAQDYPSFSVLCHIEKPRYQHTNPVHNIYMNCSANRNEARRLALASLVDHFLFVDSDIVLPKNAISSLMSHHKEVIGGWYQIRNSSSYVGGLFVADHVYKPFLIPEVSVIESHVVGLGCALITRSVLEKIPFESGLDYEARHVNGASMLLGECGIFGQRCFEQGIPLYLDGDVVCGHLERQASDGNPHD